MKPLLFLFVLVVFHASCNMFSKSWSEIYEDQQDLFRANRQSFELAAALLEQSVFNDSTLSIDDSFLRLPDSLVVKLKKSGISQVSLFNQKCKDIRFIPDSLWHISKFSVVEIIYNKCDERSWKGFHWKMEGSDHKHSLGQGNGWFIYSDSDPF